MTPFERAEKNIKVLAENLSIMELINATIEETAHLKEHEAEIVWKTVLAMLEATDRLSEAN